MKVLIVDDEPLARSRLRRFLEQQSDFEPVAEAQNGEQAIAACNQYNPDVVLMDIRMPVMDGLEAARHLAKSAQPPAIIFCTAYSDYALEAFDANAVDYLLKPVNREKLTQALSRAQTLNRVQLSALNANGVNTGLAATGQGPRRSHISATTSRGIELIAIKDVRYFFADQKYVTVYYQQEGLLREILIDDSLKELEQDLAGQFVRIHRNALVAIKAIRGLAKSPQGLRIKLTDVAAEPLVSRRHSAEIRALLQQL